MKKRFLILACIIIFELAGCGASSTGQNTAYLDTQSYEDTEEAVYFNEESTEDFYEDEDSYEDSDYEQEEDEDAEVDEEKGKKESVMLDEIVTEVLKPFFEMVEEQALDSSLQYYPVSVENMIANVEGRDECNWDTPAYWYDRRLCISGSGTSFYDKYFRGLKVGRWDTGGVANLIKEMRGHEYDSIDADIEVLESNFPDDYGEFDYYTKTDAEIKLIVQVNYHVYYTYQNMGQDEQRDYSDQAWYFVRLRRDSGHYKDYSVLWKMDALFVGRSGASLWNRPEEVSLDFFDMTPLENEWE